jgi:hypothetical protein
MVPQTATLTRTGFCSAFEQNPANKPPMMSNSYGLFV